MIRTGDARTLYAMETKGGGRNSATARSTSGTSAMGHGRTMTPYRAPRPQTRGKPTFPAGRQKSRNLTMRLLPENLGLLRDRERPGAGAKKPACRAKLFARLGPRTSPGKRRLASEMISSARVTA